MFSFDSHKLQELAKNNKHKYQTSEPTNHIYFDNFLPEDIAKKLVAEFPSTSNESVWGKYDDSRQNKYACEDTTKFPETIKHVLEQCNSSVFINFLEELTGIQGLIPDPHYRGGGMHQIAPGGFLKVHIDFNWYPRLKLERRLNVLIYLNENWKEEYGGYFELWNKDMTKSEVKILPIFNRMAMFSTGEDSYHGHPDPLKCPEGMTRKSIALYYYTSPAGEEGARAEAHSTIFKERPGEVFKQQVPNLLRRVIRKIRSLGLGKK